MRVDIYLMVVRWKIQQATMVEKVSPDFLIGLFVGPKFASPSQ